MEGICSFKINVLSTGFAVKRGEKQLFPVFTEQPLFKVEGIPLVILAAFDPDAVEGARCHEQDAVGGGLIPFALYQIAYLSMDKIVYLKMRVAMQRKLIGGYIRKRVMEIQTTDGNPVLHENPSFRRGGVPVFSSVIQNRDFCNIHLYIFNWFFPQKLIYWE